MTVTVFVVAVVVFFFLKDLYHDQCPGYDSSTDICCRDVNLGVLISINSVTLGCCSGLLIVYSRAILLYFARKAMCFFFLLNITLGRTEELPVCYIRIISIRIPCC